MSKKYGVQISFILSWLEEENVKAWRALGLGLLSYLSWGQISPRLARAVGTSVGPFTLLAHSHLQGSKIAKISLVSHTSLETTVFNLSSSKEK